MQRPSRTALAGFFAAVASVLYLWPAFAAPVVLWSDSHIDLRWAAEGRGILGNPPPPPPGEDVAHQAKPAYLAFLWAILSVSPFPDGRTVVVAQSFLLLLSLLGTAGYIWRRRGAAVAGTFATAMVLLLRVRDAASAVMPEALATAALLPIAASVLDPPRSRRGALALGAATALLFWLRPNAGAVMLLLLLLRLVTGTGARVAGLAAAGFAALLLPVFLANRPRAEADPLRGISFPVVEASAPYYWRPALGLAPEELEGQGSATDLRLAWMNWSTLLSRPDPDAGRDLRWRAFHGLFGTEYYDPGWSLPYARLDFGARVLSPFLTILAIALLVTLPFRGEDRRVNALALLLCFLLVAQNFLIGSNPRYVLPLLPALLLFAAAGAPGVRRPRGRAVAFAAATAGFLLLGREHREIFDAAWGRIEAPGVALTQMLARGSLPERDPATLHVRIAPAVPASEANFQIAVAGELVYDSRRDVSRQLPYVSIPLSPSVLAANARGSVALSLTSVGSFGPDRYLLFPVVPPPWDSPALRKGSPQLSPSTGFPSGSLDWWSHAGLEEARLGGDRGAAAER